MACVHADEENNISELNLLHGIINTPKFNTNCNSH